VDSAGLSTRAPSRVSFSAVSGSIPLIPELGTRDERDHLRADRFPMLTQLVSCNSPSL
jgi:hypothetical protein